MAALASLTANYTDSENEDEDPNIDENSSSNVLTHSLPNTASNSPASPVPVVPSINTVSNNSAGKSRKSGLVSYQADDQIDDDAIDDYISEDFDLSKSPTSKDTEDEATPETTMEETTENTETPLGEEPIKRISRIPPEPPGKCSNELQAKIAKVLSDGKDIQEYIHMRKDFRNPSIYEKLIEFCGIDEQGTNYPPYIYDPHGWPESSYFDELAKVQAEEMERREKERKERISTKVEFVSVVKKPTPIINIPSNISESALSAADKRKSKWDQRGVASTAGVMHPLVGITLPTQNISASSTSASAVSNKSVKINALGNLSSNKKPPKL